MTNPRRPIATALRAILACTLPLAASPVAAAQAAPPPPTNVSVDGDFREGWPKQFDSGGFHFEAFQPQIVSWENLVLRFRMAVAVTTAGASTPVYGIVGVTAGTFVDKQDGTLFMQQLALESADFPGDAAQVAAIKQALSAQLPQLGGEMTLAELQGALSINQAMAQGAVAQPVVNTPPTFYYSETPALMVMVDGPPALRNFVSPFMRVVNSTALLLASQGGASQAWYLRAFGGWMTATAISGPWTPLAPAAAGSGAGSVAAQLQGQLDAALAAAKQVGSLDLFDPVAGSPAPPSGPITVLVATGPAELLQLDGPPTPAPIAGTGLLYVTNTKNQILIDPATSTYYVLVSGRWFSAPSLASGPWSYVPASALPADFARIAPDGPAGAVLTSVAGTAQAREAVIANSIPQTAVISRSAPNLQVTYQGAPNFQPIGGTSLQYAVNTPVPVIQVDASSFYAVDDGVWFVAAAPNGPWSVATAVPPAIYTIPVSSPLHYVTSVRIYGADDSTVTVGYTPGYMGTVVSPDNTVVYGTGYYTPGWVGDDTWYGTPWTYGWGTGFAWAPWTGFAWGFAAGTAWGWNHPWWGPWRGWNGGDLRNVSWNHVDGYSHWAADNGLLNGAVRRTTPAYPAARAAGAAGARSANNVFAGGDGNVYRNGANGWERNAGNGWNGAANGNRGWNDQSNYLRGQQQNRNGWGGSGGSGGWGGRGYGNGGGWTQSRGGGWSGGSGYRGGFSGGGGFRGGGRR